MSAPGPSTGKSYLRRSLSTRTIRKGSRRNPSSATSEPLDLDDDARRQATVAATLAMRRSAERSSGESRRSYDSLGGPSSMAVPPRRCQPVSSSESSEDPPPSRHSVEHNHPSRDQSWTSPAALPSIHEFGGLDGQNASLPSSYRRLRKTRSMFAPRQPFSHVSHGASPGSYAQPDSASALSTPRRYGNLRRSMSFLRASHQPTYSLRHAESHEAAIQLARSEFQRRHLDSYAQSRHSSLFALRSRKYRPFRRTFRTSSADAQRSPAIERHRSISAGRARSFSLSIKRGVKRVLGLSRAPCDPADLQSSPIQSLGQANRSTASMQLRQGETTAPSGQQPTIRDMQSVESFGSTASRVTSWTDSTIVNTGTARRSRELSQLYPIQERARSNQGVAPGISSGPSTPSPSGPRGAIDSQRLYSALMRRIGRTTAQGSEEEIVLGHVKEHRAVPTRASSLYPRSSRQTIRPVSSDESITPPASFTTARATMVTPQKPPSVLSPQKVKKDDDGSITASQPPPFEASAASLSVYSRSTSGDSPAKDNLSTISLPGRDHVDETGIATIFESQRAPYSSPNRATGPSRPIQPSVDWQQWASSQMARIDTMPGRGHYREEAQLHGEATDIFQMNDDSDLRIKREDHLQTLVEEPTKATHITPSSNFSRPFSRSSSVRTITGTKHEQAPKAISPPASVSPQCTPRHVVAVNRTRSREDPIARSSMQLRSASRIPMPESPTPKRSPGGLHARLKMNMRYGGSAAQLIPTPKENRVLSQRSLRGHREAVKTTNENLKTDSVPNEVKHVYAQSPKANSHMTLSSKRMVEMFLDSRRRNMGSEVSETAVSDDAFI